MFFILATQCVKKQMKNVTKDDKRRTAVVAFGKCRWEQIKVKQGGEKWKPAKLSSSNPETIWNFLNEEYKKMVGMVEKQRELFKNLRKVRSFSIM